MKLVLTLSLVLLIIDADLQKGAKPALVRDNSMQESGTSYLSAESVAINLLKKFSEKHLPKASELHWLVPEKDAPQRVGRTFCWCLYIGRSSDMNFFNNNSVILPNSLINLV